MHKAYADGACRPNPGCGAYGFIIYDGDNKIVKAGNGSVGNNTTNTIAEFAAIIKAMESAVKAGIKHLTVYSDSQSIVRQLTGIYKTHNYELRRQKYKAKCLEKKFKSINYIYIPRRKNGIADALAAQYYILAS